MSSMLDGDDDDRSAISSLILPPSGLDNPREDMVNSKLVKFDVSLRRNQFTCIAVVGAYLVKYLSNRLYPLA